MAQNKVILFDSSGLISLIKADDQLHGKALSVAVGLTNDSWQVLLPYEVLSETLNALSKLVSKDAALKAGDAILAQYASGDIAFARTEPHVAGAAMQNLRHATGSPSFTDCLVMALADEYQTKYIFGFDATFRKNGYRLPGS